MRVVEEEPVQTLHLFVVPEDQLPPKRDYFAIGVAICCFLFIIGIVALSILAPSPSQEVSFSVNIQGFALAPMSKTMQTTVIATGKKFVPATIATGKITFYNGAIYAQIVPVNTILKGADGVSIITDEQATIPAAVQTIPPSYGQITILAHALTPGAIGNITAGDINEACCATSIIAQNTSFHGGKDSYTYTFLSAQDVQNAKASLLPTIHAQTLALLPNPQLNSACATVTAASPGIGRKAASSVIKITETCKAFSYHLKSVNDAVSLYSRRFGSGKLAHVQFAIVGMKGTVINLFITATWEPIVIRRFYSGK